MTLDLAQLLDLATGTFWLGFAVFLRVGALCALLPAFGEQTVPGRVRLVIAGAFTAIVAPGVAPGFPVPPDDSLALSLFVATEVVAGLFLGIGVRLIVMALQTAGAIAAQSTTLSHLLGGAGVDPLPAIGHVLVIAALALAVLSGLHVRAAQFIVLSYEILPPGQMPDAGLISAWGVARISHAFALAFTLAAPFVLMSMLYHLALGVINRAMPQLMVAFVGAPVITAGSLFMLFLVAPILLSAWLGALNGFLANPVGTP